MDGSDCHLGEQHPARLFYLFSLYIKKVENFSGRKEASGILCINQLKSAREGLAFGTK